MQDHEAGIGSVNVACQAANPVAGRNTDDEHEASNPLAVRPMDDPAPEKFGRVCARQLHFDSWNRDILFCQSRLDGDSEVAANLHPILSTVCPRSQLKAERARA
jgi:hypothetical protein